MARVFVEASFALAEGQRSQWFVASRRDQDTSVERGRETYGHLPWDVMPHGRSRLGSSRRSWTISSWQRRRDSSSHATDMVLANWSQSPQGHGKRTSKVIHDMGSSWGISVLLMSFNSSFSSSNWTVKMAPGGVQVPIIKWWRGILE